MCDSGTVKFIKFLNASKILLENRG
jgi:hypothetical protein